MYQTQQTAALPARRRKAGSNRGTLWLVIGGGVLVGLTGMVVLVSLLAYVFLAMERVPSGVSVAGVALGGRSIEAARADLEAAMAERTITATDGVTSYPVPLADLGVSIDYDAAIAAAEEASANTSLSVYYTIDLDAASQKLIELGDAVYVAPVPGDDPQYGRALDIPTTLDRLRLDPTGELSDGLLELDMIDIEPPVETAAGLYSGETTTHVVEPGQELALIARQYGVTLQELIDMNGITNPDLLYVGQELIVPAAGEYQPTAAEAPPAPSGSGRAILVDTNAQRIYAYENGELLRSHLVSTGTQLTPTVKGDYNIQRKYVADDMAGPDYFLPQVPYAMYFYQGYAIHGTYWHNSFGRPMSHGCVNLPTDEAEWFFNFADIGTLVRVI